MTVADISMPSNTEYPWSDSEVFLPATKLREVSTSAMSASKPGAMSPLVLRPNRRAGFQEVSSAMRFQDRPRGRPSVISAVSRNSVPPKPDFARKMFFLPALSSPSLSSMRQHAWSEQTQSSLPSSSASQRNSTSGRERIGGFTLARLPTLVS